MRPDCTVVWNLFYSHLGSQSWINTGLPFINCSSSLLIKGFDLKILMSMYTWTILTTSKYLYVFKEKLTKQMNGMDLLDTGLYCILIISYYCLWTSCKNTSLIIWQLGLLNSPKFCTNIKWASENSVVISPSYIVTSSHQFCLLNLQPGKFLLLYMHYMTARRLSSVTFRANILCSKYWIIHLGLHHKVIGILQFIYFS